MFFALKAFVAGHIFNLIDKVNNVSTLQFKLNTLQNDFIGLNLRIFTSHDGFVIMQIKFCQYRRFRHRFVPLTFFLAYPTIIG